MLSGMSTTATDILRESEVRYNRIFGRVNQFSGYGLEDHTHKVVISDMAELRTQYLNDDTYNHPLYQSVISHGSIRKFVAEINRQLADRDYDALRDIFGDFDFDELPEITTEEVYDEMVYTRMSTDPAFAFYTAFNIKYKKGGNGPFILNYAQRMVLLKLERMRMAGVPIRLVLLKARQWGGSTLVQLYMAWVQLFVLQEWNSAIIAQTKDTSRRIKTMFRKVLDNIPGVIFGVDGVKFSPVEGSSADSHITDTHGKVIRNNVITTASYENFESTRGQDYAMVHFSEVAYWRPTPTKNPVDVITNIEGNLLEEPLTMEIAESTARGAAGWFYDEYQAAKKKKSNRDYIFIPYNFIENDSKKFKSHKEKLEFAQWLLANKDNEQPIDDYHDSGKYNWELWEKGATLEHLYWYVTKRATFSSHDQMAQEAPSDDVECFVFSGGRIFSPKLIQDRRDAYECAPLLIGDMLGTIQDPHFIQRPQGSFFIWKKPSKKRYDNRYIITVDVGGRSQNADYSVITVLDRMGFYRTNPKGKLEVVARWRGHIRYDELARLACRIGEYYNHAEVAFESNTFDKKQAESSEFVEQGDHIRGILNVIADEYDNLYMRAATDPEDIRNGILTKVGFNTNKKTKQDLVDQLQVDVEEDHLIDHDERFYDEASIYEQRPDGSYGNIVGKGNHDDIVMSVGIAVFISRDMPAPTLHQEARLLEPNLSTVNESLL